MPQYGEDRIVSGLLPDYATIASQGRTFFAASQAVATTTVGLATTYTGLCVSNPVGSNCHLFLTHASVVQSVIQATQVEAVALAVGWHTSNNVTHTTPASIYQGLVTGSLGTNNSVAKADTSATLPAAPVYAHFLQNTQSATTNAPGADYDFKGSIVLAPGAYACFVTPTQASVAGMWFSLHWAEMSTHAAIQLGFQA